MNFSRDCPSEKGAKRARRQKLRENLDVSDRAFRSPARMRQENSPTTAATSALRKKLLQPGEDVVRQQLVRLLVHTARVIVRAG
jgi:hypothetical protein